MKVVILEDEKLAAQRMQQLLKKCLPNIELIATLHSVESAIAWFANNPEPELIFADIQLGDGLSFEVFEAGHIKAPIIFTTAFNEYAVRAFKHNSIDYLLKPIDQEELCAAIKKHNSSQKSEGSPGISAATLAQAMKMMTANYKSRFLIKVGDHLRPIDVSEVTFFYSAAKDTFLVNKAGRNYALDYSLDQLEQLLDPEKFFRISRRCLVAKSEITEVVVYSGSRLKVKANALGEEEAIVSRERVAEFKEWLER